jgi:hypothetical protein
MKAMNVAEGSAAGAAHGALTGSSQSEADLAPSLIAAEATAEEQPRPVAFRP